MPAIEAPEATVEKSVEQSVEQPSAPKEEKVEPIEAFVDASAEVIVEPYFEAVKVSNKSDEPLEDLVEEPK